MRFRDTPRFTPKWWLSLPWSAKDIYQRLSSPDGSINAMSYWWHGGLERRPIEVLVPKAAKGSMVLHNAGWRDPATSTTIFELTCLLMAMREVDAKKVLEIGTFNGNTTLNIAANLPDDGEVVTMDLPLDEPGEYGLKVEEGMRNVTDRQVIGQQFKGHELARKIRQVFGDTAKADFNALEGPFDVAFIDGCHDYAYVKSDTDNVLKVMRPGGCVLWHDYAEMESVSRAVDEYRGRFDRFYAVQGTRLAIGFARG